MVLFRGSLGLGLSVEQFASHAPPCFGYIAVTFDDLLTSLTILSVVQYLVKSDLENLIFFSARDGLVLRFSDQRKAAAQSCERKLLAERQTVPCALVTSGLGRVIFVTS